MDNFEKFKKELKKIDTKTLLKKEKDQWMYSSKLKENDVAYNLYYNKMLLCDDEMAEQIHDLVNKYNYTVDSDSIISEAVKNAKELNKKMVLIVKLK